MKWVDAILRENGEGKAENSECRRIQRYSIEETIETVTRLMNVSVETVRFRGGHENRAREMSIYLAQKYCMETSVALGRECAGITGSGIGYTCRKVRKKLKQNHKFRYLLEKVEKNLLLEA